MSLELRNQCSSQIGLSYAGNFSVDLGDDVPEQSDAGCVPAAVGSGQGSLAWHDRRLSVSPFPAPESLTCLRSQ